MRKTLLSVSILTAMLAAEGCVGMRQSAPLIEGSRIGYDLNLFVKALQLEKDDNVLISPYSAGVALSMLSDGAEGETQAQLQKALNGCSFAGDRLKGDSVLVVQSANSVWMRDGMKIKNSYSGVLRRQYGAQIASRDFASRQTVSEINQWCSDNTAGRIPEIISDIDPDMALFLLNALYFKAPWAHAFKPEATFQEVFYGKRGEQKVDFMHQTEDYEYAELDGNQMIRLPYKGDKYSMLILAPTKGFDLNELATYLNETLYTTGLSGLETRKVCLSLPKFKFETSMNLNPLLQSMGVKKAFSGSAEFAPMTNQSVSVDEVKQKCFIEVNEEGAEAAAVTSVA